MQESLNLKNLSPSSMLKDLKLAMEAADSSKAATPLGQHAEELYASLSRAGYDGLDFSGIMQRIKGEI